MTPQEHLEESLKYVVKTMKLGNVKNFFDEMLEIKEGEEEKTPYLKDLININIEDYRLK